MTRNWKLGLGESRDAPWVHDKPLSLVTFQYGFGDENNSVRVRVQGSAREELLDEMREVVQKRGAYPALHASVTGKLWPPSSFVKGEFCGAQEELLNPDRGAFILEYASHAVAGNPAGSNLFYTAYVWVMFIVGRSEKPTPEEVRARPWAHLLPFFEHANIINDANYEMAKRQLAHKVLTYVASNAQADAGTGRRPVRLWYVCAIDIRGVAHR